MQFTAVIKEQKYMITLVEYKMSSDKIQHPQMMKNLAKLIQLCKV